MPVTGRVLSLHRWPVKSMGGQEVGLLHLDERGAAGDRLHALEDAVRGRRLTAREAPRMLLWDASYPDQDVAPDAVPPATLRAPDGRTWRWDDDAVVAALSADLGREVGRRVDPDLQQDLGHTLLITTQATHEAVEQGFGRTLDLRRWRTNVHVVLDAEAFAEERREGARVVVGEAEFDLLHPCERCVIPTRDPDTAVKDGELLRWLARERRTLFGMNARPRRAATIRVGDAVQVHPAGHRPG